MATLSENYPVRMNEFLRDIILDSRTVPNISGGISSIGVGNDARQGQTNPGWRDRIAKGTDASSAYSRTVIQPGSPARVVAKAHFDRKANNYTIVTSYDAVVWGQPSVLYTTDAETSARAVRGIKRQLQSRTGSMKLMAPLGELGELRRLIIQATFLTTNFVTSLLRAKKTYGRTVYRNFTENWLGFNFALAPLVRDVSTLGNSIASYLARQDLRTRLTASATTRGSYTYTPATSVSAPRFFKELKAVGEAHYELSYRITGGFFADIRSAEDYTLLEHLGLGLRDIPAALWELTAFSWMFDYFTNIGDFLEDTFSSPPGLTSYLVSTRRYKMQAVHTFLPIPQPYSANNFIVDQAVGGTATYDIFQMQRTVLGSLPHAPLYFKSAETIGRNALPKLLNLLSVLRLDALGGSHRPIKGPY